MTDTLPKVEAAFRARIMALPASERWRRGALMFDAARTMALASMPGHLSAPERRRWLWKRFYPELPFPERAVAA